MVTSHPSVLRETKRHKAGDLVTSFWMKKDWKLLKVQLLLIYTRVEMTKV